MSNITAVGYEDSLCIEGAYSSSGWCIFGASFWTQKTYKVERQFLVGSLLRRALDSNQRIPYDIGSLANCWFKPLTQPSLNHLFSKEWCKYTTYFYICKILPEIFSLAYRNALCAIDIWCGAM